MGDRGTGTGLRLDGGQQPASMAALRGEQPSVLGAGERATPGTQVGLATPAGAQTTRGPRACS